MTSEAHWPGRGLSVLALALAHRVRLGVLAILIAMTGACGPRSGERELPDAARQSLARKKVDVQPRSPWNQAAPGR